MIPGKKVTSKMKYFAHKNKKTFEMLGEFLGVAPSASHQSKHGKWKRFMSRIEKDFDHLNEVAEFIGIPVEKLLDDSIPWWNND